MNACSPIRLWQIPSHKEFANMLMSVLWTVGLLCYTFLVERASLCWSTGTIYIYVIRNLRNDYYRYPSLTRAWHVKIIRVSAYYLIVLSSNDEPHPSNLRWAENTHLPLHMVHTVACLGASLSLQIAFTNVPGISLDLSFSESWSESFSIAGWCYEPVQQSSKLYHWWKLCCNLLVF